MSKKVDTRLLSSPSRFGWDFHARNAFIHLGNLYLDHPEFRKKLKRLHDGLPPELTEAPVLDINVASLGDFQSVERRYQSLFEDLQDFLGPDNQWISRIRAVAQEWGLFGAAWGPGITVIWMYCDHSVRVRQQGEIPPVPEWLVLEGSIMVTPKVVVNLPWPLAPSPSVETTREEWDAQIDQYRIEGWAYIVELKKAAKDSQGWAAKYAELERDVQWLFHRIIPKYAGGQITPRLQAEVSGYSEHSVKRAIQKVSGLLNLHVSPGVRRPKTLRST